MAINRRDFLRLGATGAALGTMAPLMQNPFFTRSLQAAMMQDTSKKMLLIFLRGGCDGVNMVIPQGDTANYNDGPDSRPTLFIDPASSHEITTYCHLHPNFSKMVLDVPSEDVALIHRVAYAGQSRSHFDSQQFWENAQPGSSVNQGWVNSLIGEMSFDDSVTPIPAASVGGNLQVLFRGSTTLPHITNLSQYSLDSLGIAEKILGALPGAEDSPEYGAGLLGVYSREADARTFDDMTRGQGLALASSLSGLAALNPATYVPEGGATYPTIAAPEGFPTGSLNFFRDLKQAVMLLKLTDCRVAGVELGGFDTHVSQAGNYANLMRTISHGISAVYRDTSATSGVWDDLAVVTMSEFGRTSAENGSNGTDHGEGSCMIVAGGGVVGGAYNCDATTWGSNAMFGAAGRYVSMRTDYRTILAELVDKHFGQGDVLDDVIPGWTGLNGTQFDELGFIETV